MPEGGPLPCPLLLPLPPLLAAADRGVSPRALATAGMVLQGKGCMGWVKLAYHRILFDPALPAEDSMPVAVQPSRLFVYP